MSVRVATRLAYAAVILLATLAGLDPDPDLGAAMGRLERAVHRDVTPGDAVDGIRNIALFAGWGVVWVLGAPLSRAARALRNATLTGAALSLTVEIAQLLSPERNANVLDVLTNTLGASAGAALVLLLFRAMAGARCRSSFVGAHMFVLAGSYFLAVLTEAVVPLFRQEFAPGAEGGPSTRIAASLARLQHDPVGGVPWMEALLFMPAGILCVLALVELGRSRRAAAAWTGAAGFVGAALAEVVRGVVGFPVEIGSMLVHGTGMAIGGVLGGWIVPRLVGAIPDATRARAFIAAYAVLLAGWAWRPFVPRTEPDAMFTQLTAGHWVPLRALAERGDLFSVADVGVQFLLFVPLGAVLAVWPVRTRGLLSHLAPALLLAVILEAGQIVVAERFFDVTDLLLHAAGAAVGWVILRRAGFPDPGGVTHPARVQLSRACEENAGQFS